MSHTQSSNALASLQNPPTIAFDPPDMIEYVHHAQRTVSLKPRTYWCEFSLERFPLEKAEFYQRLKEAHDIKSVRALAGVTGEDWSYIARVLKTLALAELIKDYLRTHKNDPVVVKFFHLRILLDIVRQGEERLQLGRFMEYMDEFEAIPKNLTSYR